MRKNTFYYLEPVLVAIIALNLKRCGLKIVPAEYAEGKWRKNGRYTLAQYHDAGYKILMVCDYYHDALDKALNLVCVEDLTNDEISV